MEGNNCRAMNGHCPVDVVDAGNCMFAKAQPGYIDFPCQSPWQTAREIIVVAAQNAGKSCLSGCRVADSMLSCPNHETACTPAGVACGLGPENREIAVNLVGTCLHRGDFITRRDADHIARTNVAGIRAKLNEICIAISQEDVRPVANPVLTGNSP